MSQEQMTQSEVAMLLKGEHVPKRPVKQPQASIEITLPLPPKEMHPNARKHWRSKMKPKQRQRNDAYLAALAATQGRRQQPFWTLAEVHTTWYLARRNDQDN